MELTSGALVNSLIALAVVALVATLWLWPRLARQRPLPMLGRVALLTVVQVSVLAVLLLSVNNTYGFFTSWNDLLNPGGAPLTLASAEHPKGAAPKSGTLVQPSTEGGLETVKDLPQGKPEEVGRVDSIRVTGPESGLSDQVFIYLPPEYFVPRYARERFPVLVTLAGYPGPSLHLVEGLKVPQTAWDLQRTGRMAPTVIVMARPSVAPPRDTECVDVAGGPRTETWFAKDLPNALRSGYRVSRSASSWGVLGYSTGGSCALRLAMRNPGSYASGAGMHADYQVPNDHWTDGDLFGGDEHAAQQSDLDWRLRNLPAPKVSLLVVSTRTEENYQATQQFLAIAKEVGDAHPEFRADSLFLDDGGHSFETWRRELPAALEWMSDHLKPPQDREPRP
ncbi:alpha/beta hydrolase-fold protein [Kitasatospora atroaurantiaca]|uniref:S-formylglutathione hydrolase FrmB n=1 Tax=Kitasatospora atroaurantiaca TaxID=285545 RepID=A0A561ETM3_9ACTN|nr:alpha/beta hydrolase-fold protein [Kitasatospora atroaurantiaca]TWE18964.1 S-formylglutathione hydrolase FrmB [Kitasatospora atroaurantiaca]